MWGFYFNELMRQPAVLPQGALDDRGGFRIELDRGHHYRLHLGNHEGQREQDFCDPSSARGWTSFVEHPFWSRSLSYFFILPSAGIELEAFPAAVIALSNLAACFICEIVAGGILAVPSGQREAATASGLSAYQQLRYIVLPQAMRTILPPLVGQYVLLVKDSSVVSAIGVVDITRVGWLTVQRIPEGLMVFGLVGILYFIICYPLINLSNLLERRMSVVSTRL